MSGRRVNWLADHRDEGLRTRSGALGVLIVDDRELVHYGLRLLLAGRGDVERCLGATSQAEAIELLRRYEPSIALVDQFVDQQTGIAVAAALLEAAPQLRVIMMTGSQGPSHRTLSQVGIFGCISRVESARALIGAIESVARGERLTRTARSATTLSEREAEVIDCLARGWTNAQIADALFLSVNTVKDHTRAVYRKLDAQNRAQAVAQAQRLGLVA